jgi:hypothetical protein
MIGPGRGTWQERFSITGDMPVAYEGLQPHILELAGELVTGANTNKLWRQNKRQHHKLQDKQQITPVWTKHTRETTLPPSQKRNTTYLNEMCPTGLATSHPAGELLAEWSKFGCPTRTGKPWTKDEMWEVVDCRPHQSSLSPEAIAHFAKESAAKVSAGQAKLVLWDNIKDNPPPQLKISPIAAIPHKSKVFWSILDLSFCLRLIKGGFLESVNNSTLKLAPKGALDQLGHSLSRIIHAFMEAPAESKNLHGKMGY